LATVVKAIIIRTRLLKRTDTEFAGAALTSFNDKDGSATIFIKVAGWKNNFNGGAVLRAAR
jgi:hypothetical protein